MTSAAFLPRPPAASESGSDTPRPRPRTDLELAAEAWRFVNRQVQKVRDRRATKTAAADGGLNGKETKEEEDDAGSVLSEAETVVEMPSDDVGAAIALTLQPTIREEAPGFQPPEVLPAESCQTRRLDTPRPIPVHARTSHAACGSKLLRTVRPRRGF
ncbi:hypothetical protein BO86DRAFT_405296 [Aspergillus japonicus CBS 114.51]|uniref:Uncharacterized protein n=1 Tax=Aspergillus japonicus CBS 114.51 TaxID=1448312 RepID=A0A8T8WJT1_ASPJA|nr:hypothetical protein BO86DRAFT_405296 [Aspergillus japonicus CBS 114.51]RAH75749.1 hypothetical protein BO86DRAFT_405296 [Aspergillus japonicus CBS 114.51]